MADSDIKAPDTNAINKPTATVSANNIFGTIVAEPAADAAPIAATGNNNTNIETAGSLSADNGAAEVAAPPKETVGMFGGAYNLRFCAWDLFHFWCSAAHIRTTIYYTRSNFIERILPVSHFVFWRSELASLSVCVFLFAENLYFRNSHDSICVYLITHTHTYTLRHIRTHTSTHACAHVPIRMHVANAPQKSPEPIWGDEIMQSLCVCVCLVENASAAFGHRMIDMHM